MSDFDLWNKDTDEQGQPSSGDSPDTGVPDNGVPDNGINEQTAGVQSEDSFAYSGTEPEQQYDDAYFQQNPEQEDAFSYEAAAHSDSSAEDIKIVNLSAQQNEYGEDAPVDMTLSPNPALAPRKKAPKWIFAVAGIAAAAVITIVILLQVPSISNAFSLITMSPAKYYAKVEKQNMNPGINAISEIYGKTMSYYIDGSDKTEEVKAGAKVDLKLNVNPTFAAMAGLEEYKDALQNIEANSSVFVNNGKIKSIMELLYNNNKLGTLTYFMDTANNSMLMKIDELSDAYLSVNPGSVSSSLNNPALNMEEQIASQLKDFPLTEEMLNKLLKRYINVIVDNLTQVTLEKNKELTIDPISGKCTEIKISISNDDIKKVAIAVLNKAADDKDLKDLVSKLGNITDSQYTAVIAAGKAAVDSYIPAGNSNPVIMTVYVDNSGKIIGRSFDITSGAETVSIGYNYVDTKDGLGYQGWIKQSGADLITLTGNSLDGKDGADGEMKLLLNIPDMPVQASLAYNNVKVADKKKGYFNGSFTLSSDSLPGYSIVMDCTSEDSAQKINISLMEGSTADLSLEMNLSEIGYEDFDIPSDAKTYDMQTGMEDYLNNANMDGFLDNLGKALNIDPEILKSGLNGSSPSLPDNDPDIDIWDDGLNGDNKADEPGDDWDSSRDINTDALNLPDGVEVDEYGYYNYEVDYDTIMAAGKGSTGYTHFPVKASDILKDASDLASAILGEDCTVEEPYLSNQVSGCASEGSAYEYTYYSTKVIWTIPDDYNNYISINYDTVTDEMIEVNISTNKDTMITSLISYAELLRGAKLSDSEKNEITEGLAISDDNYASYEFDDISFYISYIGDTSYGMISAKR